MRRTHFIGLLLAGGLALGGIGHWQFGIGHAQPKPAAAPAAAPRPAAVETAPVRVDTVTVRIDAIGTLQSQESVVLSPEIDGVVADILFDEGTAVEAGVPLVRLDDAILKAELDQAKAELTLAQANFERADTLLRQSSGTRRALDEAIAAQQSARARVRLAETQLDKTVIRAPFSGVLGLRPVSRGEYVSQGEALIGLQTVDPLRVEFRVPETFLTSVKVGLPVGITADALPGRSFEGRITAIDPQVDVNGRALRIRAEVPNPERVLRSGLFVRVGVTAASRADALLVPEGAILPEGDLRLVYRIVDGKARRTTVVLGERKAGEVEVLKGLSAGDEVVTAGQQRLRDGTTVVVVNPREGT
ncbi:efflux RND transporter periplasmic adaptor subunit [Azospirillum sp. ST 5-10]|uniref:efflux RND transporter periplasmic adaptor subunit n=1 Tax=unclassified Azospirillum TaxID=2630922 RepID=UPI003F4A52F5